MFRFFLFSLGLCLLSSLLSANPYYSIRDGDWSNPESWSLTEGGFSALESPTAGDTVYINHQISHNTGGTYKHTGDVFVLENGGYYINSGSGSSKVYKFEGNRFEVFGTVTTSSDFLHQASWTSEYGILILHQGSGFAIGDDLILCGTSETILNTELCGNGGTLDDIYFRGTQAKICGQGYFYVVDRMRAWNDSGSEVFPASDQIVNQICAGFALYSDPGICATPGIVGGGTFVLQWRDFGLRAKEAGPGIRLSWLLDQEAEGDYFVERSADGVNFQTLSTHIHRKKGRHHSVDPQPISGRNYYRIRLSHSDGRQEYSRVISMFFQPGLGLQVDHTKITTGYLMLRGIPQRKGNCVRIYDASGHLVQQSKVPATRSGEANILLPPDLSTGVYVVELLHPSSLLQTRFIIP
ncbi:MAG: T9SS type A sorting domain-containing protein [Bacteroidota bacterium]